MATILGISGSLRAQSYNTRLLKAAQGLMPDGHRLDTATLHGIPLYDGDVEAEQGIPEAVTVLRERIKASDGLLLVTPEYNSGIPGVFKNALDWLSRPPKEMAATFGGRPVAVIGASPSGFGTVLAQTGWLPVLKALGLRQWSGGQLMLSRAHERFDEQGALSDERSREQLRSLLAGFVGFVRVNATFEEQMKAGEDVMSEYRDVFRTLANR